MQCSTIKPMLGTLVSNIGVLVQSPAAHFQFSLLRMCLEKQRKPVKVTHRGDLNRFLGSCGEWGAEADPWNRKGHLRIVAGPGPGGRFGLASR